MLAKAIAADPWNAACHYNIATSYQALGRPEDAVRHFKDAIAFGARQNSAEKITLQNPVIANCIDRIERRWPLPVPSDELFPRSTLSAIAGDLFLRCALETVPLRGVPLERFLTPLRAALTGHVHSNVFDETTIDPDLIALLLAVAQQCFINEYVFAQSEQESQKANQLRDHLLRKSRTGERISSPLLAAVAAHFPLHALPEAPPLLAREWPNSTAALVRQQLIEPLQESEDRARIPLLTSVDDAVSLAVMRQYEENPYPRWTINPLAVFAGDRKMGAAASGSSQAVRDILLAGCGSGQHAFDAAQHYPSAQILAVDVSLPSLAYARRKTREAGLSNVEYAQADILKLGTIGRRFDRIEAVGVLHHLAEPEQGWRALLSLLRPQGEMRVGLYSETARRGVVAARALIAERGYRPTAEDIRKCRQEILRGYDEPRWSRLIEFADFYSMSGCRDLLFNVMEHRFTIPRIRSFLDDQNLAFLGFEIDPSLIERFQQRFPGAAALTNLDHWQAFEAENPQTFRHMYVYSVRKA